MDIFKWAEEYSWCADYLDPHTGKIYKCTEANEEHTRIPVYQDGVLIGYVNKEEED